MQTSVEKVSNIKSAITVTIPAKEVDDKVSEKLNVLAKHAKVQGFRPGKVPAPVLKKNYGAAARQEVISQVIQEKFYTAIVETKVHAVGMPQIDIEINEEGKDLVFKAEVEVFPEVELKGLDKVKVEKPVCELTEKDVDQMFETLRKQHAEFKPVKRAAKDDDQVVIDFEGFVDGKAFDGGSANDMPVVLGSQSMIPGFEEGLVGIKADEERELDVNFPENYQAENLAGKPAKFKVKAKEINEPELPELNDEFAKKFNVDSLEVLRREVKQNMARELEFTLKGKVKEQVTEGLLAQNEVEVPESLVTQEIDSLRQQAFARMGLRPEDLKGKQMPELPADLFKEQAEKRVKLGVLMNRAMQDHDVKPEEDRVNAHIEKIAQAYENPKEVVEHYKNNQEMRAEIEQAVLEDLIVESLLASMQVKDKKVGFFDIMRESGQNPNNFVG